VDGGNGLASSAARGSWQRKRECNCPRPSRSGGYLADLFCGVPSWSLLSFQLGFLEMDDQGRIRWDWATSLVIGAAGAFVLWYGWRRRITAVKTREEIVIYRAKTGPGSQNLYNMDMAARNWSDLLVVTAGDREIDCKVTDLREYLQNLWVSEAVDLRKLAVTVMTFIGMDMILPVLGFIPPVSAEKKMKFDPHMYEVMQIFFRTMLSPVTISAAAATYHKTYQGLGTMLERDDPVKTFQFGCSDSIREPFEKGIPNPFSIERDFRALVAKVISAERTAKQIKGHKEVPVSGRFFPGLFWGNPGIDCVQDEEQRAISRVLSVLFNRMSANVLRPLREVDDPPFLVSMELDGKVHAFEYVADLIAALQNTKGYRVEVDIMSTITSFGANMYVRGAGEDSDSIYHLPLSIPMRTGISSPDGDEIVIPMAHAGVVVEIHGGVFKGAGVDWYQMVSSFTGFMPRIWMKRPWQFEERCSHVEKMGHDMTPKNKTELVRCCELMSIMTSVASRREGLVGGGYGYTGVCLDSVAVVQAAVFGDTSIFPMLLSGQARTDILKIAIQAKNELAKSREAVGALEKIINSIVHLDTDIDITPKHTKDACRRILATLPDDSMYELIGKGRKQCMEVMGHIDTHYDL